MGVNHYCPLQTQGSRMENTVVGLERKNWRIGEKDLKKVDNLDYNNQCKLYINI